MNIYLLISEPSHLAIESQFKAINIIGSASSQNDKEKYKCIL